MKKALIFIFVICLCFVFSCSRPVNQTFSKEHLTPSMYKMLGMLAEYISRWSVHRVTPRNENLVELFYPREKRLAETFEELINQYNKELKENFEYSQRTGKQGHIYFYSQKLTRLINSFHMMKGRYATLNPGIFSDADINSKIAFLEGVYIRWGIEKENIIRMYNALNKIKTIGMVLESLGCKNIYIYSTEGLIPRTFDLVFEPGELVQERLEIEILRSKEHVENQENFQFHMEIN